MSKLIADLSMSLDGFVAGPEPSQKDPLGIGGEQLHEWAFAATAWRQEHGLEGGADNADSALVESLRAHSAPGSWAARCTAAAPAGGRTIRTRAAGGVTTRPSTTMSTCSPATSASRSPMEGGTTFHYVTDGVQSAYEQAVAASGGKDVQVHGGGSAVSQFLRAGLLDELTVHVAPVFLGSGARLLDDVPAGRLERLEHAGLRHGRRPRLLPRREVRMRQRRRS